MRFLGSKLRQDQTNNVFEQKNIVGKIFGPPGPPTEKIFGLGPGRPGRARGQPKGGQNRSVGVSNPSKTVGHPQGTWEKWGRPARITPPLAKVMPKTRFWPALGADWGRGPVVGRKNPPKT